MAYFHGFSIRFQYGDELIFSAIGDDFNIFSVCRFLPIGSCFHFGL